MLKGHAALNVFLVSANNVGAIQMEVSAIYNPKGLVLAKANPGVEEIMYSDIEIDAPEGYGLQVNKSDKYLLNISIIRRLRFYAYDQFKRCTE